jgi:hypothetical protein
MKRTRRLRRHGALVLAAALLTTALLPGIVRADPGQTQKGATAATAAAAAAWVNYGRKTKSQGRRNTAIALTGAAAYLWKKGEDERRAESRKRAARERYHRRRAAYYKRAAARNAQQAKYYRQTRSARR